MPVMSLSLLVTSPGRRDNKVEKTDAFTNERQTGDTRLRVKHERCKQRLLDLALMEPPFYYYTGKLQNHELQAFVKQCKLPGS